MFPLPPITVASQAEYDRIMGLFGGEWGWAQWIAMVTAAEVRRLSIVQVDVSPRTMGADMAQLQQDGEKLKAVWGSRDSNILVVEGKTTAEALANGRAVAEALRRLEPDNKLGTLTDVWPSQEQAQANVQRWQAFAKEEGPRVRALLALAAQRYGFTARPLPRLRSC